EAVDLVLHLSYLRKLGSVLDDERLDPRVVDDVLDQVRRIARVDRNGPAAGREDAEVRVGPRGPARGEHANRLTPRPPERDEAERHLARDVAHLSPRER